MTVQNAYSSLMYQLFELYSDSEAAAIADMVVEEVIGFRKIDRITHPSLTLSIEQKKEWEKITLELLKGRPIQYVLGYAWFGELKLEVNEHVLIPRPETEELVLHIKRWMRTKNFSSPSIIDIGTGSGCIAIALQTGLPKSQVFALDASKEALTTAQKNFDFYAPAIQAIQVDFLDKENWQQFGKFECIVSNPPYIAASEKASMEPLVWENEPNLALFVPDNDPLIFYRQIAAFAMDHLSDGGSIWVEINQQLGPETCSVFKEAGFETSLIQDMHGNNRIVHAY